MDEDQTNELGSDDATVSGLFEQQRPHLRAVAYRMLGSEVDADDAVQEAWLRLTRSDVDAIENLGGWLTTVVARISLDMLRSRARRDDSTHRPDLASMQSDLVSAVVGPEDEAVLAESVSAALIVVLDTLAPAERLALVLHDMFGVPFDEIGTVLGRSPNAAKQLASRARQKVRGTEPGAPAESPGDRAVVDAFLTASRTGDLAALVAMLHPDVVLRADEAGVRMGSPETTVGPEPVAQTFSGRAMGAVTASIDGVAGMAWIVDDRPKVLWEFTVEDGQIVRIDMVAASGSLGDVELDEVRDPTA